MNGTVFPRPADGESPANSVLWWVLTIEAERSGTEDDLVRLIVGPLSTQARAWGSYRFGFVRNFEADRPQIRFHLRAPVNVVDRVWKFAHAVAAKCERQLGVVELSEHQSLPYPPRPGEPVPEIMEAVFARYGGQDGLQLVGEVTELASDLAVWSISRFPTAQTREPLAALLLFDAGQSMMWGPRSARWADRRTVSWNYYWENHLRSCGAGAGQAERGRLGSPQRIEAMHHLMAELTAEPSIGMWRTKWARAIDMYLFHADKKRVSRSAQELVLAECTHLCNRMGFSLDMEAKLGAAAQRWSKEREKSLL